MKFELNKKNYFFYAAYCLLMFSIGLLCFYHLETAGIQNWDEARHGVNAYEMLKSNSIWIHTYQNNIDYYNYKPPLSMWIIMINYLIFGFNTFAMRFGSAVVTIMLCLFVSIFLSKEFNRFSALLFLLFFSFNKEMMFFHMARSGDGDAIFQLCFCLSIIFLFYAGKTSKYVWYFLFGMMLSFAFMAKAYHAFLLFAIAFFFLLLIKRYSIVKWFRIAIAIACGFFPVIIWGIIRFQYDGLTFLMGMFHQEVSSRIIHENNYWGYVAHYLRDKAVLFMLIFLFSLILIDRVGNREQIKTKKIPKNTALFLLWVFIPLVTYSISGAFMEWYGYTSLIGANVYISILGGAILEKNKDKKTKIYPLSIIALLCAIVISGIGYQKKLADLFYEGNQKFRVDILTVVERYPEYTDRHLYIENSENEYKEQNQWEQNLYLEALYAGDFQCIDGGVPVFVADEDGLLIISKNLFADYTEILTGRVILLDGEDYLVFENKYYQ